MENTIILIWVLVCVAVVILVIKLITTSTPQSRKEQPSPKPASGWDKFDLPNSLRMNLPSTVIVGGKEIVLGVPDAAFGWVPYDRHPILYTYYRTGEGFNRIKIEWSGDSFSNIVLVESTMISSKQVFVDLHKYKGSAWARAIVPDFPVEKLGQLTPEQELKHD